MKILCPQCRSSVELSPGELTLSCASCELEAPLSQMGTAPGVAGVPLMLDRSGTELGGFELEEILGFGGMGTVYRGTRDDVTRAIKVLHPDARWSPDEFVARFERECQALTRLEHEGIVRLVEVGEVDGLHYMVMELAEGKNLATRAREASLTTDEIIDVMDQVCAAIASAHDSGIVHRDLKPANIVVSDDGRAKVLDFGLAQMTGADVQLTELTRTDIAMGTFNYLSPEQRTNAKGVDHRADLFALGVIFYELLTDTLPIGRYPPPSRARPGLSKAFDRIVEQALEPDPADRYQAATEMQTAIAALRRPEARRRLIPFAAAAAALALAAGGTYGMGLLGGGEPSGAPASPAGVLEDGPAPKSLAKEVEPEPKSRAGSDGPAPVVGGGGSQPAPVVGGGGSQPAPGADDLAGLGEILSGGEAGGKKPLASGDNKPPTGKPSMAKKKVAGKKPSAKKPAVGKKPSAKKPAVGKKPSAKKPVADDPN